MKDWTEIKAWRRQQRAELLARREALPAADRRAWNEAITASLEQGFPVLANKVVGFCWPYKAEFDPRFAIRYFRERGAVAALPEVVDKKGPLQFRKWWPGAPMRPGVYDIPVPDGTEIVAPEAAIVPMVGFDERGYRLGYGGGYFDRTLAATSPRPLAIGVAYEALRLATIYPRPHDLPMDFVVTEKAIYRAGTQGLAAICAEACAALLRQPRPRSSAGSYSSPPCYAHEIAPGYFGEEPPMPAAELAAVFDALLEAERAGAKALAAFLEEYPRDTPAWNLLRGIQRDEAENCAVLMRAIRRLGGVPSGKTGDFLGKVLAVEGRRARLEFLNRGQGWVVRKINEALPKVDDEQLLGMLKDMRDSHVRNIEACEVLIKSLQ